MRPAVTIALLAVLATSAPQVAHGANLRGAEGAKVNCPPPAAVYQGTVTTSGLTPGSRASYSCMTGTSLKGPSSIRCTPLGTWDRQPPECRVTYLKKNDNSYKNNDKGYQLYSG